ncbi:MAG: ABC transporter ATP-binding protein [Verrucomicrobiota bacterium]
MKPIIEIRDLRKKFRKTVAVDGLNLTVPEGAVTAFLGPNGAGKTTTIKCLLNIHCPDAGSIEVMGVDSRRLDAKAFQQIAYVSENQELPLWMTVQQFMDYCRPMYPTWDPAFAAKLLKQFDLPTDAKLKALSRGMRMKAALLGSLAYRPKLVVLDEPFSGLDPLVRDEFIRGMLELTENEGWTVFVSSHDIAEVERMADRVAILHRGRAQLDESSEELQTRFRNVEVVLGGGTESTGQLPETWLNVELSGRVLRFTDSRFNEKELTAALAKHFPNATASKTTPMSLREIFVALARTYRLNGAAE